jgi:branched-subunit amino acid aminotransferase/4-amino-4-deoxychorismate lyase
MKRTLIETVRIIDGRAPLWSLHLDRLSRSCAALEVTRPGLIEPRGGPDRVIRFSIRSGGVEVLERQTEGAGPIHLVCSPALHRGYRHKLADRAWLQAARSSALMLGADDAVLFSESGVLVEGTKWAIGWWEGEALCFPPLTLGGLPSVARARLAETVRGGLQEAELTLAVVYTKPLLACNAARGVVPVGLLDGAPLPLNHHTLALQSRFWNRPSA